MIDQGYAVMERTKGEVECVCKVFGKVISCNQLFTLLPELLLVLFLLP